MRIPGRYWWVSALCACALAAFAIVFPVQYLGDQMSQDIARSEYSPFDATLIAIFAPFYALVLLGASLAPGYYAAWSLAQFRRRKRALNGDVDAMLLAFPPIAVDELPDLAATPLVLHWRARKGVPRLIDILMSSLTALLASPSLVILGFLIWNLIRQRDKLGYFAANALQFIVAPALIIVIVVMYVMLIRMYQFQAKHFFGVTATPTGLECIHEFGRRTFIPWGEARLFEVELRSKFVLGPRIWRLYSSNDTAEWVHRILFDNYIPDGISAIEMRRSEEALARVIAARTGLRPRTLSKALIASDATEPLTSVER